jgi:hypothetical protein
MTQTFTVGARSLFVSITAWVFILLGLLAAVLALVQTAVVSALPFGLSAALLPHHWLTSDLLASLMGVGLLASLVTLAAGIGLLLRQEWARRSFIALLWLAIAVNLGGLWLQQLLMLSLVDVTLLQAPMPPLVAQVFSGFVAAARLMAVLVTLAGCAMLGWIAWRLTLQPIRQEFA